jgi:hypothetical protein
MQWKRRRRDSTARGAPAGGRIFIQRRDHVHGSEVSESGGDQPHEPVATQNDCGEVASDDGEKKSRGNGVFHMRPPIEQLSHVKRDDGAPLQLSSGYRHNATDSTHSRGIPTHGEADVMLLDLYARRRYAAVEYVQAPLWPSFEKRLSKSAVVDFDTFKCRSQAGLTLVAALQDEVRKKLRSSWKGANRALRTGSRSRRGECWR